MKRPSRSSPPRDAALPRPCELHHAPELAALTVLDTALAVARWAVLVHNPDVSTLRDDFHRGPATATCKLAARIVVQADRLRDLLGRYRGALEDMLRGHDERDDLPF